MPGSGGFAAGIFGGGIFDSHSVHDACHFILPVVAGADADDYQTLALVLPTKPIVMRDRGHAWAAPRRIKIDHDDFAFQRVETHFAVDPIAHFVRRHRLAFELGMAGAHIGVVVPGPAG